MTPNSVLGKRKQNLFDKSMFITLTHSGKEILRLDFFEKIVCVFGEMEYANIWATRNEKSLNLKSTNAT